jgi:Na+-translocating ferredoxin:NAD+ oxidoreductase subunit B
MMKSPCSVARIDALLPQTQCGLCGYAACRPYAQAIADAQETLDRCLPGGERVLTQLGELLQQDISALLPNMRQHQKPASVAVIREDACIGCTKCIQACPVDAILGSGKLMHTILSAACTGCGLCLPPCPMDCIDLITLPTPDAKQQQQQAQQARRRYLAREQRLAIQASQADTAKPAATDTTTHNKADEIAAAVARVQAKRNSRKTNYAG